MNLLDINSLGKHDILQIWKDVSESVTEPLQGCVAWSFEGNGIRTRTTFIQAFQKVGLDYIELPNLLKTHETVDDLAGYLDPFYSLYVIRERNHQRMADFANATTKPVINAMTSEAHPCEVLTDAYYLHTKYGSLENLRILLWGPMTNVLQSWHSLSAIFPLNLTHCCPAAQGRTLPDNTCNINELNGEFDIVITDAWPTEFHDATYSLSPSLLTKLGHPELLPTPPVTVGHEVLFQPNTYFNFSGYEQKRWLLPVQTSIIRYVLTHSLR